MQFESSWGTMQIGNLYAHNDAGMRKDLWNWLAHLDWKQGADWTMISPPRTTHTTSLSTVMSLIESTEWDKLHWEAALIYVWDSATRSSPGFTFHSLSHQGSWSRLDTIYFIGSAWLPNSEDMQVDVSSALSGHFPLILQLTDVNLDTMLSFGHSKPLLINNSVLNHKHFRHQVEQLIHQASELHKNPLSSWLCIVAGMQQCIRSVGKLIKQQGNLRLKKAIAMAETLVAKAGCTALCHKEMHDLMEARTTILVDWELAQTKTQRFLCRQWDDGPPLTSGSEILEMMGILYKILAKTIAIRITPELRKHSAQTGFIGRSILNNILTVQLGIEHAINSKQDMVMFQIDFEKAFDTVQWDFVSSIMTKMGFGARISGFINLLGLNAYSRIVINGRLSAKIRTSSHQLEIEFGRFQGIPPEDRLCKLCGTEPETELHYFGQAVEWAGTMANAFRELEALMDHNISRVGSRSSRLPPRAQDGGSLLSPLIGPEQAEPEDVGLALQQSAPLPLHSFAMLSLAFAPAFSPTVLPSSTPTPTSKPNPNPHSSVKSALTLPSSKKCALPTPFMPAISTAALATETPFFMPSSKTKRSFTAFPDYQRLPDKSNGFGDPSNGAAMRKASIVWFRNDLRCHDNEALAAATKESLSVLPVYCFDPRDYGKSSAGFDKTGPYRAKFLLECVSNLRENLRERGSDLVVRVGKPEEILVTLAKSIGADALYAHQEVSCEEVASEKKVSAALQEEGVDVKYFWGSTLFHADDLPFKLEEMPITYSGFREKVQSISVRQAEDAAKRFKGLPIRGGVKPGDIPTVQELGLKPMGAQRQDGPSVAHSALIGGEVEALKRLKSFAAEHLGQGTGKSEATVTGANLYGSNFSCKISPWLAMGCLSPRRMFEDLQKSAKRGATATASSPSVSSDNGLNWLVFELLWRDFFRFITKKYAVSKQTTEVVTAAPVPV
ncbi:hypothetical protein L7F22_051113 [Adiantum nelumboides]|nr:hypothetical protein [Adiantum nelumboides]